jgi:hypothetical protein
MSYVTYCTFLPLVRLVRQCCSTSCCGVRRPDLFCLFYPLNELNLISPWALKSFLFRCMVHTQVEDFEKAARVLVDVCKEIVDELKLDKPEEK